MNISKVNYSALNCMKSNCTGLNVFSMGKKKANMEKSVMDSMVLWYDLKKQGATNESMQANPVLVDHSGNGHNANCQNFAWTEESGINTTSYPNAIVSDGVDDKITCPAFKLGKDYTLLFDVTWMDNVKASVGLVKSPSFFVYNNVAEEDKLSCFVNRSSNGIKVPNTIIGINTQLGFIDKDFSIIEDSAEQTADGSSSTTMIGYNGSNFTTMALRKLLLFDRALSLDEIKWAKNNLMEETI